MGMTTKAAPKKPVNDSAEDKVLQAAVDIENDALNRAMVEAQNEYLKGRVVALQKQIQTLQES